MQQNDWLAASGLRQGIGYGQSMARLGIIFICFFTFLLISAVIGEWVATFVSPGSREAYLLQSVSQCLIGFIGAAVAAAYWMAGRPWRFLGAASAGNWKAYLGVAIIYLLATPALNQLVWWNEHLTLPSGMHGIEEWMRTMEDASAKITDTILGTTTVGGLISGILIIGVLTGVAEEFLFRGALQRTIATYPPLRHLSIWLAAFIFSAMHMQFFGFFPRFAMGAFFGYLLYATGSVWPGVFAHALNNSTVVFVTWLANRGEADGEAFARWGVAEAGIPRLALGSLLLTSLFLIFCHGIFFRSRSVQC